MSQSGRWGQSLSHKESFQLQLLLSRPNKEKEKEKKITFERLRIWKQQVPQTTKVRKRINTTMRYPLTPTRMADKKNKQC